MHAGGNGRFEHGNDQLRHVGKHAEVSGEILATLEGYFGEVARLMADSLEVGDHLQRARNVAQVSGHRLAAEQDFQAERFDYALGAVDFHRHPPNLRKRLEVAAFQRLVDCLQAFEIARGHVFKGLLELLELGVKMGI